MSGGLLDFLNARLDEDEAVARKASGGNPRETDFDVALFIGRFDPARELREVAAKRALIMLAFLHQQATDGEWGCCHTADEIAAGECGDTKPEDIGILRHTAGIYSDHEAYDPAWAPDTIRSRLAAPCTPSRPSLRLSL